MKEKTESGSKAVCMLVQNHYEIDIRVRRKAEALAVAGYQVDVLALASSYSKEKSYTLNGVTVHTLTLGKQRGSLFRYLYEYLAFFVWCFFKLNRLMKTRRYSIVDANNLPDFLVFAGLFAKWRGARIVFDMHEITPEFYMSKYKVKEGHPLIRILKWLEKVSFRYADHVITINEPIKKLLERRGLAQGKTTIIMNAVDEALFASAQGGTRLPEPVRAENAFIMMYHGTLTHIYGLDISIEAFHLARAEMPGAELWILGGGGEKARLQELTAKLGIADKVKFVGNVLPQEVPQWLKRADAGVLATRSDVFLDFSFSNKLSEYIVLDKPVISSRLKTIHHYFSEEALAFFEPNQPADLAKQMIRLYRDPELRKRFVQRAKQEYSPIRWEIMKERYLALTEKLVGGAPGLAPATSAGSVAVVG
jgi:glycosyltransferase involved in cell wall biosynthesis